MKYPIINAEFYISARILDHSLITSALGIIPSKIRTKDSFPMSRYANDEWSIDTASEETRNINILLSKLIARLSAKGDIINDICLRFSAKCGLNIIINDPEHHMQGMYIEHDILKFVAYVNAQIGFVF